jgi:predicted ribonuclease YlaK
MKRTAKTAAKKVVKINSLGLELREINPMTETQNIVFRSFYDNHLLLHGIAGTGKTFISLYLALKEMLEYGTFKKIYIVRSAVATRDVGFNLIF